MIMNKIEQLVSEFNIQQQAFETKMKEAFSECFKEFFEQNPEVKSIGWAQYTPWFNDGDECVFRTTAEYADFSNIDRIDEIRYGEYVGEGDFDQFWIISGDYGDYNEELVSTQTRKNVKEFSKLLGMIPDDIYKSSFGDHVRVFATRDGFEVEEYEHD